MKTYQLDIVATTDLHSYISLYDYFMDKAQSQNGLILAGSKIRQIQHENSKKGIQTLVVDNGDILQGNLVADYAAASNLDIHPIVHMMNVIGYDVGTLGNHEFNYGLEYLKKTMSQANFPIVNSNVLYHDGTYLFKPYEIIEKALDDKTVRIGVIGVVPQQIMMWDNEKLKPYVTVNDMYEAASYWAKKISDQVDVVLCLCHSGFDPSLEEAAGLENQVHMISKISEIDAIVFGHTHQRFPSDDYQDEACVDAKEGRINGTLAVQPVSFGSNIGIIHLTFETTDNGLRIVSGTAEVLDLKDTEIDSALNEANLENHQSVIDYINQKIGVVDVEVDSFFSQLAPSRAVEIVAKAGLHAFNKYRTDEMNVISTSAPLKAGRDGSEDYVLIKPGDLTLRDAISIYRFPNKMTALKIPSDILYEWLEWSVSALNCYSEDQIVKANQSISPGFPSYNMDIFYELDYQVDLNEPPRYNHAGKQINDSKRITQVIYQGETINNKEFIVLTNDYRANFTPFLQSESVTAIPIDDIEVREAVIDYIKSFGVNFTPKRPFTLTEEGQYSYKSSHLAEQVAEHYPIKKAETLEDGFIRYIINTTQL